MAPCDDAPCGISAQCHTRGFHPRAGEWPLSVTNGGRQRALALGPVRPGTAQRSEREYGKRHLRLTSRVLRHPLVPCTCLGLQHWSCMVLPKAHAQQSRRICAH
eukprot:2621172-Prymnesium_polylepis.2